MTSRRAVLVGFTTLVVPSAARAATLTVPGQYATPCAAIAAAQANDEIDVSGGPYTDSCEINTAGLTLKGVSGQPKIDLSGTNHPADYKGIYVISANDVTVENLELTGAHIDDTEGGNAAGLRITGQGVVVQRCYIHDNQNGILAAPIVDGGTITIQYTELSHNGMGDGCDVPGLGCTHNVYISKTSSTVRYDKTLFQYNWSHDLSTDTTKDKGHLLKSRSRETDVLYNRITGEMGGDSYEIDVPNGGLAIILGNAIEKGPNADNSVLIAYGEEGIDNPMMSLYVVSNSMVNDFTGGTFINVAGGATLTAHDNIMVGPGTPSNAGVPSADNMSGVNPMFVNLAAYDYHLMGGSPAIGKAVSPGSAGTFSLVPMYEYVHPLGATPRTADADLGAFEYGTVITDGGVPSRDGGSGSDGGPLGDASTGDGGSQPGGANGGCGCGVARPADGRLLYGLPLAFIIAARRRRSAVLRAPRSR